MSAPDLTFTRVGYAYGPFGSRAPRTRWAVGEVTVTFRPGVITGLLGRNGAGKSTMLALAAGLRRPTAGSVTTSGSPVFEGAVEDIALLGAGRGLIEDERIDTSLRLWSATRPGWDQAEAERLLELFEIPRRSRPDKLSEGRRSALDAVFALACHASVLLLDEIHRGMDVVARRRFWDELLASYVREQQTIVISSHHIEEIEDLLEDAVILDHGAVLAAGTADDLRAQHTRPSARDALPTLADILVDLTEGAQP